MSYYRFKHLLDFTSAGLLIIMLFPVFVAVASVALAAHGRPLLFIQKRAGLNGREISVPKFRTMSPRPPRNSGEGDVLRILPIGRFMRKFSLDELPQLFLIFKGDMSFVGPRPLPVAYLNYYSAEQNRRHLAKPGLTGLAQVSGRNFLSWSERFELDLAYIENQSFRLDMKIIFRTLSVVMTGAGTQNTDYITMPPFLGN